MTGDIYGNEYRDAEGFIIAPPGWVRVAAYTHGNGPDALCEYDGEIFTSESDEGNLLRFDVDTLTEVAPYIFPVEGVKTFMEYSTDGKLHAAMPRRRIYQWNGVDAWVELYNGGAGNGYVGMVELGTSKIYVSTGADGQLIEWDASPTIVAPKFGNDGIAGLVVLGGEIYGGTYYTAGGTGGRLFKWNGVNAWTQVAGKYSDSRNIYAICVHAPFWCGTDIGWKSCRSKVFERFPRTGLPERFTSWSEYAEFVNLLVATGSIDNDCPTSCGNGVLDSGETCDPMITSGYGSCSLANCTDQDPCTHDYPAGSSCNPTASTRRCSQITW